MEHPEHKLKEFGFPTFSYTQMSKSNGPIAVFQGVLAWKRLFWNGFLRPIQEEYRYVLYLILTVLKRPLKWDRARLWTPTGSASTGRQSWTFEKTSVLVLKRRFFSNIQLWRPVEADPVGVQRRALSHFKGLFKTVKMRYSTYLYSYWIGLKYPFQKSRFTAKTPWKRATVRFYLSICVL